MLKSLLTKVLAVAAFALGVIAGYQKWRAERHAQRADAAIKANVRAHDAQRRAEQQAEALRARQKRMDATEAAQAERREQLREDERAGRRDHFGKNWAWLLVVLLLPLAACVRTEYVVEPPPECPPRPALPRLENAGERLAYLSDADYYFFVHRERVLKEYAERLEARFCRGPEE